MGFEEPAGAEISGPGRLPKGAVGFLVCCRNGSFKVGILNLNTTLSS